MQIGKAAELSGASAKMIRHYESIGLIAPAERRDSNYRDYSDDDVARLRFVRRARDLGFPIERIRELLALWGDRGRSSAEVKRIALDHVAELEGRIAGLRDMVAALHRLADGCAGDGRPDCPIIEGLAGRRPSALCSRDAASARREAGGWDAETVAARAHRDLAAVPVSGGAGRGGRLPRPVQPAEHEPLRGPAVRGRRQGPERPL